MRIDLWLVSSLTILIAPLHAQAQDWRSRFATPFEQGDGWDTAEYQDAIAYYQRLAKESPRVTMSAMGKTDCGFPLHVVLISGRKPIELSDVGSDSRPVLLINNAIHPGESDGVDASMAFARDLAFDSKRYQDSLDDVLVAIIPIYNIGGALNRNKMSRANQNGPREYGFRGNARNYDLNRDFVKCDTLNARCFAQVFQLLDPDLFIDTHVSNGADYQHVMTTSHSQKDKLGQRLGDYLDETLEPKLFSRMRDSGYPTIPYVNSGGSPPDQGFSQFLETPRYSTGYAALFQTIGFMTETHMLKPYPQRVKATRVFLDHTLELLAEEGKVIQDLRRKDRAEYRRKAEVAVAWEVDRNEISRIEFHGYEASYIDSRVTSGKRLFYDREKPYVRNIPYFNHYRASRSVKLPKAYLIPRQWSSIIELMRLNRVEMQVVDQETVLSAEVYRIEEVESRREPYEGHYFHDRVTVSVETTNVTARPGDVIIPVDQDRARYVVETLEPEAIDSLFRWNYFDTILQRKEYFSPYVFEDSAEKMLAADDQLRAAFEARKKDDATFAGDRKAQLSYLYERSGHNETAYRRYPVARLVSGGN